MGRCFVLALLVPLSSRAEPQPQQNWFTELPDVHFRYAVTSDLAAVPTSIKSAGYTSACLTITPSGELTVRAGFGWSGPSWWPDDPLLMRASAYHDALYRLMRAGHISPTGENRKLACEVFANVAKEDEYAHPARARRVLTTASKLATSLHQDLDALLCVPLPTPTDAATGSGPLP